MLKKISMMMLATFTVVALAVGSLAFKDEGTLLTVKDTPQNKILSHTFYFKAESKEGDILDHTAYQSNPTGITCSGGNLPCEISVPDLGGTPDQDLQAYLSTTSAPDVVLDAIATRP